MLRPAAGVKALILSGNQALILVTGNGQLDLPGGRVEDGEAHEDALRREISEETGLEVQILSPLATWRPRKNNLVTGITYLCRYSGGKVTLSQEHEEFQWRDLNTIRQVVFNADYLGTRHSTLETRNKDYKKSKFMSSKKIVQCSPLHGLFLWI